MSEFYEGIMEGLNDALAYVKGDISKGRTQTITVVSDSDSAAEKDQSNGEK